MNIRCLRSVMLLSFAFMTLFSVQAYAETKIAVVDIDIILSTSKAAKSVKKQVDQKRGTFLDEVKKEEEVLRTEQSAIKAKSTELSKEELVKKAQEFEKRRLEARNSLQKKKDTLDKSYSEAMNTLTNTISDICQDLAKQDGLDLIITKQNIIIGNNDLDITAKVMALMDEKLPKLSLK